MAGNMWEWTTEIGYWNGGITRHTVFRGGAFYSDGSARPISTRHGQYKTDDATALNVSFRVVLYLK